MNQYLRRKIWTLNRSGKFRGYLRTVSGYPVTLTDCMAGQPVSMAVDGNAVQDGTPTPDNPVDVQLCGDRTVNLFDETLVEGKIGTQNADLGFIEDGKTYSVTCVGNGNGIMTVRGLTSENDGAGTEISAFRNVKGQVIRTFTADLTTYVKYVIRYYYSEKNDIHNIMLIEGAYTAETMPAYEPYGYKVPLTMTGINLLSNNENDWVSDAGIYKHFKIPVEGTTTLQVKIKEGKSIPEKLYLGYSKNGMDTTGGVTWLIDNGIFNGAPIRTSELKYISIHPKTALLDEIFDSLDIMLIEGAYTTETMPAYESYREPQTFNIYTPQQLAKVGGTADTVVLVFDNKTAVLTQNIISLNLKEVTGWYNSKNDLSINGFIPKDKYTTANGNEILCNFCKWSNIPDDYNIMFGSISGVGTGILLYKSFWEFNTVDELKQYISSNDIYCYYAAKNPIITDITALQDWDAMPPLWSGTAVITADTVIAPSAITAKYYASKPEEVN